VKQCGVYAIRLKHSTKAYIGSSVDIVSRWTHHRFMLRRGRHKTPALQAAWTEHGEAAFEFVVVEHCEKDNLRLREDQWIMATPDRYNFFDNRKARHSGPSATKKAAAVARWKRPEYREKRAQWLAQRDEHGRFMRGV